MELNDQERVIIAGYLAEDHLAHTNAISAPVYPRKSFYTQYVKRALDLLISSVALIVTFPVNLVIGIVTFFDVGSPIFFRQQRIGKDCKPFSLVKFRNMRDTRDAEGNLLLAKYRVTKWGRFVRKTSLDELLNFWSVFKGDMSIIGPRPLVMNYMSRYSDRHKMRHAVRPGLECPLIGLPEKTGNRWQDNFENDVWYVENVSFLTDLKMLLALFRLTFDKKETEGRKIAFRGGFMGYDENGMAVSTNDIPEQYVQRLMKEKNLGNDGQEN